MSKRRRFRLWALVLFCLAVECAGLGAEASTPYGQNISWLETLVSSLYSGRAVVPANDGPPDYRIFRSAGEMAALNKADQLYPTRSFIGFERAHHMVGGPWIYLPTVIPVVRLATLSDFGRGFLIWTVLLTLVSVLVLRAAGIPWPIVAALFVSPAVWWNFNYGQFGLISGALFVASLVWTTEERVASGVAAGLLTMKPQAGLLLPVIYVAGRRVRDIAAALVTFVILVALSLMLYGVGVWTAFLHQGLATAHKILVWPFPTHWEAGGISIFWMARSFGLGVSASYGLQVVGAVIAAIWCWLAWRDPEAAPWPRIALTTCLATFVSPYGFVDDLCAFSLGIALLAWHRGTVRPADTLFWAWPGFAFVSVLFLHVVITPLVILAAAIYAHAEMKRDAPARRMEEVLRGASAPTG